MGGKCDNKSEIQARNICSLEFQDIREGSDIKEVNITKFGVYFKAFMLDDWEVQLIHIQ